ncbi:zinc-dependent alcohol dehydrogenase family protein [Virgibacillus necropolis]|uniref:Alcohol dehydrogenase n=1 Tax=Virgibacillus necropolis TaxID=163877 RepID=A0A221MGN9_9BACI|nr:zinc-dependent alcohol dehydrogenase family protein [Virgibacillus necropolis]ASN06817.1 alcohol dehydrogenase [Virgibacillus necropolis]
MKSRVAVLHEMGLSAPYAESKPLKIETLELDNPKQNEVLVQIKAAGLCHSDLSVINGSRPRPMPMALGHEAAGIIVQVGENVTQFQEGDHVVCTFIPSCGHCLSCREGRPALCEPGDQVNKEGELFGGGSRLHSEEGRVNHHLGVSGFAEYAVVSTNSIVKVDSGIPFETIALFGCAVITGVGAVINTAQVQPGSSVAVVGLGGIGLNAVMGAKLAGAREIIAIDINQGKFDIAKKFGATSVYDSSELDVVDQIKTATGGGLDYVFETAGVVPAMEVAYQITKRGGTTVTTGLPHPEHKFSFPQVTLAAEERTIKGSYVGSCIPSRDIPHFIELFKQGRLPVDLLLSDTLALDEINEGFDRLAKGDVSRLVVKL